MHYRGRTACVALGPFPGPKRSPERESEQEEQTRLQTALPCFRTRKYFRARQVCILKQNASSASSHPVWSLCCRPQSFWIVAQERTLLSALEECLLILFIERLYGKAVFFFSNEVLTCICALEEVVL